MTKAEVSSNIKYLNKLAKTLSSKEGDDLRKVFIKLKNIAVLQAEELDRNGIEMEFIDTLAQLNSLFARVRLGERSDELAVSIRKVRKVFKEQLQELSREEQEREK